ncbi:ABCC6 [Cordylochernes scorpioides]|uniref:ABCC6 n=1 Tax=Cordylochernes scorpioides TaxID=51811 RepID=A0ABY6LKN5_9ARAC|nr:ABCC6 [Cordylochernes scorpioides]
MVHLCHSSNEHYLCRRRQHCWSVGCQETPHTGGSVLGKPTNSQRWCCIPGEAITITKANFRWSEERMEPVILKDITLHVPKGALVAVIGTVGSGKSSLLSAMLGEMSRQSGSLDIQVGAPAIFGGVSEIIVV